MDWACSQSAHLDGSGRVDTWGDECHVPVWRLAISLVQRRISRRHALDDAAEIRDRNRRREGVKDAALSSRLVSCARTGVNTKRELIGARAES